MAAGVEQTVQYLTFRLCEETFALDITQVREVLDYTAITRVPRMPEFMRGVINLRGSVVPVVDLRLKLGMGATERTVNTCIIIAEVAIGGECTLLGALADSVQEVIDLGAVQIEPPPRLGTSIQTQFIRGMGKHDESFVIILDVDRVFTNDELTRVQGAGAVPEAAC
ncbi:MAG TPA: chemotaxis protein CheW [Candidatus Methanoperedens sp.]|nr:chemotaxis protein CheW [Candidatus Methanoperedens sp.]